MGKLIVSLSPHAHGTDTVERNMYGVIIALLPALLVSFWFFGIGSAIVYGTSVISSPPSLMRYAPVLLPQ
jgi:electron transport complex protein RnfD